MKKSVKIIGIVVCVAILAAAVVGRNVCGSFTEGGDVTAKGKRQRFFMR